MATNVFGSPVTNDTVRLVYPNLPASSITAQHRAEVAILYMHQENRMGNLNRFVYNLVPSHSSDAAATFGMLYNATGNTLRFFSRRTWGGDVFQVFYPAVIQNGQWAGFLHLDTRQLGPSKEAIVYTGQDASGATRYWVLAWTTQHFGLPHPNHVYTTIEGSPPSSASYWNNIERFMNRVRNNFYASTLNRCFSSVTIGSLGRAEFVGIMTLAGVIAPIIVPSLEDDDAGETDAAAAVAAE